MGKKKNVAEAPTEAEIPTTELPYEAPPEAQTVTEEPAPEPKKAKRAKKKESTGVPGNATLADIAAGYIANMESEGKSDGTVSSYRMELRTAMNELGETTPIAEITTDRVREYFESPRVTKLRSGKSKARPSIDKTRRVLRLALCWASERGIIEKAPIPETATA